MDTWNVVGFLGIVFTSAQMTPQIIKVLRTRQVRDLSMGLMVTVIASSLCWMMYGIHMGSIQMAIANGINIGGALLLAYFKVRERKDEPCRA